MGSYVFLKVIVSNIKQARPIIFEMALTEDDREEGFLSKLILLNAFLIECVKLIIYSV